jgi:hypothetical protein
MWYSRIVVGLLIWGNVGRATTGASVIVIFCIGVGIAVESANEGLIVVGTIVEMTAVGDDDSDVVLVGLNV